MSTGRALERLVPALLVKDMAKTLTFYQELGFQIAGCHPNRDAPSWAEVCRDAVCIQFHTVPPCGTPPEPICSGTFYCYAENVCALAAEFQGKVAFAWGPEVMDYGMYEFGVQDPNGYYVAFTQPAPRDVVEGD